VDKFKHVVGIIHTNYLVYTRSHTGGIIKEPLLYYVNQGWPHRVWFAHAGCKPGIDGVSMSFFSPGMCRANCHKIIKLSGALQEFAAEKEEISNVHGVRTKVT